MIKNERQYKITKGWLKNFGQALKEVSNKGEDIDPLLIQLEGDAIRSQMADLKKDIREYERLKIRKTIVVKSVFEISTMLISARIMRHMTQKQLAQKVGVAEQQIQRYEETDYQNASLSTIHNIANILNITTSTFHATIKNKKK